MDTAFWRKAYLYPDRLVKRKSQFDELCGLRHIYRGADKSLARPGRKQVRKHVRDARDFNKIEKRAVINFFFPARQGAEGNLRHSDRNISLFNFLVGLRTYRYPCMYIWIKMSPCVRQNFNISALEQFFSTAGPRPGTRPCHQLYQAAREILLELITNLNVILYLSTCHTVHIIVLILFMIMP